MKKTIFIIIVFIIFFKLPLVFAAVNFNGGVYTNICGTGFDATANRCNQGCNSYTGICSSKDPFVVKWTCDGKLTECRNNESTFTTTQSVVGTTCGKTVQIDIFDKNCRSAGGWSCEPKNLLDYFVWYSGDCSSSPTPTVSQTVTKIPTPKVTAILSPTRTPMPSSTGIPESRCNELTIISGNNSVVPAVVTFKSSNTDAKENIGAYRFYFGDGNQIESNTPEVQHTYEVSGTFLAKVEVRDARGSWKSSVTCEKNVTVKSSTFESHKSSCSNLFIVEGNNSRAPVTVKTTVTGFDNKNTIQGYKMDFNGTVTEQLGNTFERTYDKAGTYTLRGYIKDSQGNWKGNEDSCRQILYISTDSLVVQPATGTPTVFSLFALGSGLASGIWFIGKKHFTTK